MKAAQPSASAVKAWKGEGTKTFSHTPIEVENKDAVELEVHVKNGRLQSVHVDEDEIALNQIPAFNWPDEGDLEFGLMGIGQRTVFEQGAIVYY